MNSRQEAAAVRAKIFASIRRAFPEWRSRAHLREQFDVSDAAMSRHVQGLMRMGAIEVQASVGNTRLYRFVPIALRLLRSTPHQRDYRKLIDESLQRGVDEFGYGRWVTSYDLASRTGIDHSVVGRRLLALHTKGELAVRLSANNRMSEYRVIPTGECAPLFPTSGSMDTRYLAHCWGGYTYRVSATPEHKSLIVS
jgi:ribosomal protein S25